MNSFILLSLLVTVIAAKSPRLKFVVHGRRLLVSVNVGGFITESERRSLVCVMYVAGNERMNGWTDE